MTSWAAKLALNQRRQGYSVLGTIPLKQLCFGKNNEKDITCRRRGILRGVLVDILASRL